MTASAYTILTKCPVCGDNLEVTDLHCNQCSTHYEGHFKLDKFNYLTKEQKSFIEVFLRCRGNIREVEKELNISYPTVRGKLDDVIQSLGYTVNDPGNVPVNKKEILDQLSKGEITYEDAVKLMKG